MYSSSSFLLKKSSKYSKNIFSSNLFLVQKLNFSTSPYPFRPGYGLGSLIPPGVIYGMEAEGKLRGKITVFEQILNDLEQTERTMNLEKNALVNDENDSQELKAVEDIDSYIKMISDKRNEVYGKKIDSLKQLFDEQQKLAEDDNPLLSVQAFNAGAMSPVKWNLSEILYKERASDSITINARFFNYDKSSQNSLSTASKIATEASLEVKDMGREAQAAVAAQAEKSVRKTSENRTIESTVLITAKATHSKVMQFGNCIFDEMLLLNAWNYYFGGQNNLSGSGNPENSGQNNDPTKLRLDVSTLKPSDIIYSNNMPEYLSMVSEMFMGSVFVGMVHFLQKESTQQGRSEGQSSVAASMKFSAWLGAIAGDSSIASSAAKNAIKNTSKSEFDIKFDLCCLGYAPPIESNTLTTTIKEFKNFDPSNFKIEYDSSEGTQQDAAVSEIKAQNQRQANMKAIISSTIDSVTENSRNSSVLDMESFMNAFNDYCKNAPEKDGVGIPIGLNVRSWTRDQIALLLWNKYIVGQQIPGIEDTTQTQEQTNE